MNIYRDLKQLPTFEKSVVTIGSFDGLHRGHTKILQRVVSLANEIQGQSVVITFYPHPRKILDRTDSSIKILNTLDEKIDKLQSMGIDNLIVIPFSFEFSRLSPREYIENFLIKNFNPAYIVIGYDHRFGLNRSGDITLMKEYAEEHNFQIIEIPKQELEEIAISSTAIRKSLLSGEIGDAIKYLGEPYVIMGKVVHGDKFGTKLGFPTANLQVPEKDKLIPKDGLYTVKIDVDTVTFFGVMYVGKRPSIGDDLMPVIEVHIFDFDQNIYERVVKVSILNYLRDDIKHDSIEDLKTQMAIDVEHAKEFAMSYHQESQSIPDARICIAILNYNGVEMFESYLPMVEYSSSKHETEVYVIDNNSTDDSVEYIEEWHPEINIINLSKNYGFADGYNRGLVDVKAEYSVILNSDVLVTENWLDPIIAMMDADPSIGVVQPIIMSLEDKNSYEYAGAAGGYLDILGYPFCRGRVFDHIESIKDHYNTNADIFWASGAAMVVRTKVFFELGGFDALFFAHQEEIDFCWRAQLAGYRIVCCNDSKVYHLGGGTLNYENPKKDFYNFRNNLIMLTKNESFSKLLWLLPVKLILDGIAGIKFLLEGKWKSTSAIVRAHIDYYVSLPTIIETNNKDLIRISRYKIGPPKIQGRYHGSIVYQYYVRGVRTFDKIFG